MERISWMASFSAFHWAFSPSIRSRRLARSCLISSTRALLFASGSFSSAFCSIVSWMARRSSTSMSWGRESISMRRPEAASSTRSIALSGRKRSVM